MTPPSLPVNTFPKMPGRFDLREAPHLTTPFPALREDIYGKVPPPSHKYPPVNTANLPGARLTPAPWKGSQARTLEGATT